MIFNQDQSISTNTKSSITNLSYLSFIKGVITCAIIDQHEIVACCLIFMERDFHWRMDSGYWTLDAGE